MFEHGQIVVTAGIASETKKNDAFIDHVRKSLSRHLQEDWGDIHTDDKGLNEQALIDGDRLMSVYKSKDFPTIWIITEADRSVTTVLFPDEY